jgi:hypothetical protein
MRKICIFTARREQPSHPTNFTGSARTATIAPIAIFIFTFSHHKWRRRFVLDLANAADWELQHYAEQAKKVPNQEAAR